MDNFIERLNIAHYLELLKTVTDPIKREMLQQLLVEERVKQVSHVNVEK
jgi:predicted phosphatase